jgi:N-acetylmuramoyl-L-alanine amidase
MNTMLDELDELLDNEDGTGAVKTCVDPGHGLSNSKAGAYDPGATQKVGTEIFAEADIALRYALTLRKLLEDAGAAVFMTRTSSAEPAPLAQRATRAAKAGCQRFVSIHLNSYSDPQANGVTVLYRDDKKDKPLAEALQKVLVSATGLKDRKTNKRTDLAVLKFKPGPAVLIELGVISNEKDRNFLVDGTNRDSVCAAIAGALG